VSQLAAIRLGTRGSPLALWQARWVGDRLEQEDRTRIGIVPIRTTGDRVTDRPLAAIGGKGLFTKELDQALLDGQIDLAVHSLKDLPFRLPDGVRIAAVLERGDPRDAVVSTGGGLGMLPPGSRVGTSSLRRRAQILHRFPRIDVAELRGNVETRLGRLDGGDLSAVVLSGAGLTRLGHAARITEWLDVADMLPAVGQGAVVAVCRTEDVGTSKRLEALDHPPTRQAVTAERAMLELLEGNCQIPIAGYAVLSGDRVRLTGLVARPDGTTLIRESLEGPRADPAAVGRRLGENLLDAGAGRILDEARSDGD
jgi:hydroxymethylbilane synthase